MQLKYLSKKCRTNKSAAFVIIIIGIKIKTNFAKLVFNIVKICIARPTNNKMLINKQMKAIKTFAIVSCAFIALFTAKAFFRQTINKNEGFAVVELFTSEGCSSCPPADALVAKIETETADKPVYILAFHVDYWDRLGWKDAFSSADFTKRQKQYANWLKLESVYTPQIVVNGQTEFVGSQENSLRNAIKTGLQNASANKLNLTDITNSKGKINLRYTVDGVANNIVLLLTVVQKTATTNVQSGENKGKKLLHVQIVRQMESIDLKGNKTGLASINLSNSINAQQMEIIGFLQNTTTGKIISATKAML